MDDDYLMKKQAELQDSQTNSMNMQNYQQASMLDEQSSNIAREQLELAELMENLKHILKGDIQTFDKDGNLVWEECEDIEMKLLTPYGVNFILSKIRPYLDKNTLLSNYDEQTILEKIEDFGIALVDGIYLKYEKIFRFPSEEEVHKELMGKIERKVQTMIYNKEIYSIALTEEEKLEIRKEFVKGLDLQKERMNIREFLMKDKLKEYELLVRCIIDTIHSAYNRALFGAERRTLRQHISITENMGEQQNKARMGGWNTKKY